MLDRLGIKYRFFACPETVNLNEFPIITRTFHSTHIGLNRIVTVHCHVLGNGSAKQSLVRRSQPKATRFALGDTKRRRDTPDRELFLKQFDRPIEHRRKQTPRGPANDLPVIGAHGLEFRLDAMPKAHLTFIVTVYGKPRSKYGLGNDLARRATEAGLPKHCRLDGLKKGGMRRGAEKGMTAHELMALSGHKTLTEVQRYTEKADKKRLASSGMAKMRDQSENSDSTNLASKSNKPFANPLKNRG